MTTTNYDTVTGNQHNWDDARERSISTVSSRMNDAMEILTGWYFLPLTSHAMLNGIFLHDELIRQACCKNDPYHSRINSKVLYPTPITPRHIDLPKVFFLMRTNSTR